MHLFPSGAFKATGATIFYDIQDYLSNICEFSELSIWLQEFLDKFTSGHVLTASHSKSFLCC